MVVGQTGFSESKTHKSLILKLKKCQKLKFAKNSEHY